MGIPAQSDFPAARFFSIGPCKVASRASYSSPDASTTGSAR